MNGPARRLFQKMSVPIGEIIKLRLPAAGEIAPADIALTPWPQPQDENQESEDREEEGESEEEEAESSIHRVEPRGSFTVEFHSRINKSREEREGGRRSTKGEK